jgi:hypothetical protein
MVLNLGNIYVTYALTDVEVPTHSREGSLGPGSSSR